MAEYAKSRYARKVTDARTNCYIAGNFIAKVNAGVAQQAERHPCKMHVEDSISSIGSECRIVLVNCAEF